MRLIYMFSIIILGKIGCSDAQTVLPYRVQEEEANFFIDTLSQSEYMTQNFDSPQSYRYVFFNYPFNDETLLHLEQNGGALRTIAAIDREEYCAFDDVCYMEAEVGVIKEGVGPVTTIKLRILLEDINDNVPTFQDSTVSITISEAAPIGTSRTLLQARDRDGPTFGIDNDAYELSSDAPNTLFKISHENDELDLILLRDLDFEEQTDYTFQIIAHDLGSPPNSALLEVNIQVMDFNDHAPVFVEMDTTWFVSEDTSIGTEILQVRATDEDTGLNGEVVYSFSDLSRTNHGSVFVLNSTTGSLKLVSQLDYEIENVYLLEIVAKDLNSNPQSATATVEISVQDVNDNPPRIQINTLTAHSWAQIEENKPTGSLVAHVSVVDKDTGDNGLIMCLIPQPSFDLQAISTATQYKVVTTEILDREVQSQYQVLIRCMDFGTPQKAQEALLNVTVTDINDNTPRFTQNEYRASKPENNGIGASILTVEAMDIDFGENGTVTYSIYAATPQHYVEINEYTGVLRAATRFDYEDSALQNDHQIIIEVHAKDGGRLPNSASAQIIVDITDINDQAPTFTESTYTFSIGEDSAVGTELGYVSAIDNDSDGFNTFQLSLMSNDPDSSIISIHQNGSLTLSAHLDRERQHIYYFSAYAIDDRDQYLRGATEVIVNVEDANDNVPYIVYPRGSNTTLSISNQVPINHVIIEIDARDADIGINADIQYALVLDDDRENIFYINRYSGKLSTLLDMSTYDYQEKILIINVSDQGMPSHSTTLRLTIIVDSSIPYRPTPASVLNKGNKQNSDGQNRDIIIGLAVATVVIVAALLIGIMILRRKPTKSDPQSLYTHTIQPSTHNQSQDDKFESKVSVERTEEEVGLGDTLNSNGSNDSGRGPSEPEQREHRTTGLAEKRPTNNRSNAPERLSLNIQTIKENMADTTQYGFSPDMSSSNNVAATRRQRAISESSTIHSPLEFSDSAPLWQGSLDRMSAAEHGLEDSKHGQVQLRLKNHGPSFARFSTGSPSTPNTLKSSLFLPRNAPQFPDSQGSPQTADYIDMRGKRAVMNSQNSGPRSAPATPSGQHGGAPNQSRFMFPSITQSLQQQNQPQPPRQQYESKHVDYPEHQQRTQSAQLRYTPDREHEYETYETQDRRGFQTFSRQMSVPMSSPYQADYQQGNVGHGCREIVGRQMSYPGQQAMHFDCFVPHSNGAITAHTPHYPHAIHRTPGVPSGDSNQAQYFHPHHHAPIDNDVLSGSIMAANGAQNLDHSSVFNDSHSTNPYQQIQEPQSPINNDYL